MECTRSFSLQDWKRMPSYMCIRHALCFVNLLFWVLGCGTLGVGIWMHLAAENYATLLLSHQMLSGASLIIFAGIMTLVLGFFGCCGSWFQNKCLLRAYFTMVIIVLLLEFTTGTLGFVYRKHVGDVLQDELLVGLKQRYSTDNKNGLKEIWDNIQTQFNCCGVKNYKDWFYISAWIEKEWVPPSCCLPTYANVSTCGQTSQVSQWNQQGCYPMLHSWLTERLYVVGIICLAFAFVQLFGIVSALIVICSLVGKRK